jgi:hypothetical protein
MLRSLTVAALVLLLASRAMAQQADPSDAALRADVRRLGNELTRTIGVAYRKAWPTAETDEQREMLQDWRVYLVDLVEVMTESDNPRQALIDLWGIAEQVHASVKTDEAQRQFGPAHGPIREATATIVSDIEAMEKRYLPDEVFQETNKTIDEYVVKKPMSVTELGQGVGETIKNNVFSLWDMGKSTVSTIASVPLMPGRAVSGVREGADQLQDFNVTASRFTNVVERLPEETREQAALLLTQLADQQTTLSRIMTDLRRTAEALAATAQHGTTLTAGVRGAIDASAVAADRYTSVAMAVEKASLQTTLLIEAIKDLGRPREGDDPTTPGRPFDVREYETAANAIEAGSAEVTRTIQQIGALIEQAGRSGDAGGGAETMNAAEVRDAAEAVGVAAENLNALLAEIDRQSQSGHLEKTVQTLQGQIDPAMASGAEQARDVIDHWAGRVRGLLFLAFVMAVILLAAHHTLARRRTR